MNHVAALRQRALTAEHAARMLCRCAGFVPESRVPTPDGTTTPRWALFLQQAYGVLDHNERKKG